MFEVYESFFKKVIKDSPDNEFCQKLFKAYILAGGTTKLADYLGSNGYRKENGAKYTGKEIKQLLLNPAYHFKVHESLLNIVLDIVKNPTNNNFENRLENAIRKEYGRVHGEYWHYSDKKLNELLPEVYYT